VKTFTVLGTLALILIGFGFAHATQMSVKGEVVVEGAEVTLADVIEGAPVTWHRVQLGSSPRPGRTTEISGKWIERKAAKVTDTSKLHFPTKVSVTRVGQLVKSEDVERAVIEAVVALHGNAMGVSVTDVNLPNELAKGELTFDVRLPRGPLPQRFTLPVVVKLDGKQRARALALIERSYTEAGKTAKVVKLSRAVRKGEIIRPEDVELVETSKVRSGTVTDLSQALGMEARRSISAGTELKHSYLVAATVIEKNDMVRLVARIGAIVATTSARALEAAAVGESVLVENTKSGRVLQGMVRQSGIVEVMSSAREVN
jgi:flagella basal body P-ring formation protein FlgA